MGAEPGGGQRPTRVCRHIVARGCLLSMLVCRCGPLMNTCPILGLSTCRGEPGLPRHCLQPGPGMSGPLGFILRHSQSPTSGYTCCFIAAPPAHSWITSPGGHSHQSIHWALLSPKPVAVSQAASSLATSASASWLLLPWAVGRLACVHHRGMLGFGVLPAQSRPLFPYLAPGYSGSHPQSPSDLQSHMGGSPSDGPQSSVCPAQQMEAEWAVQNANLIAASLFLKMPPWLVQRQEPWCDSEALRIWTAFSLLACSHPLDRSSSAASPEGPLAFSAVNSSATPL
nr:uncharacterized protein LOC105483986 isoform X3 [Macaca nemestrina]